MFRTLDDNARRDNWLFVAAVVGLVVLGVVVYTSSSGNNTAPAAAAQPVSTKVALGRWETQGGTAVTRAVHAAVTGLKQPATLPRCHALDSAVDGATDYAPIPDVQAQTYWINGLDNLKVASTNCIESLTSNGVYGGSYGVNVSFAAYDDNLMARRLDAIKGVPAPSEQQPPPGWYAALQQQRQEQQNADDEADGTGSSGGYSSGYGGDAWRAAYGGDAWHDTYRAARGFGHSFGHGGGHR